MSRVEDEGGAYLSVDEALADVHRHFCGTVYHDDVCVALHDETGRLSTEQERADYYSPMRALLRSGTATVGFAE